MSSITSTTGDVSAIRSMNSRQAGNSRLRSPSGSPDIPSSWRSGSRTVAASSAVRYSASVSSSFAAADSAPSSSTIRQRIRTISASAQNATPSP